MTDLSKLEDLLPTKLAQKIALSTLPVAIGGATLVHFLSPLMRGASEAEIVLLQIAVFLFLALLGSLAVIVLVVRAHNDQRKSHAAEIEAIRDVEKKTNDFMAQQINYQQSGIV